MSQPAIGRLLPIAAHIRVLHSLGLQQAGPPHRAEALLALRQFRLNWLLIAAALVVFDVCLLLTDFRVRPLGYLLVLAVACVYGVCGHCSARTFQVRPRVLSMLTTFAQNILGLSILTSLTYIATAADLPLQDSRLLAIDRALGFDFRVFLNFVNDRGWLVHVLAFGYRSISWQTWLIIFGLPLVGYYRRSAEYISALLLALALTSCITLIVPAIGVYHALELVASEFPNIEPQGYYDTLHEMPLLRAGTLRTLDLDHFVGVVTFPSFHAAAAVLYSWALWPLRWVRPFTLAVNGAMLAATPIGGGHYLVDVLTGVTVAIGSISAARLVVRLLDMPAHRRLSDVVTCQAVADMG